MVHGPRARQSPSLSRVGACCFVVQLGLSAAQSIGAVLGGITPKDIDSGEPMRVLDVLWQVRAL